MRPLTVSAWLNRSRTRALAGEDQLIDESEIGLFVRSAGHGTHARPGVSSPLEVDGVALFQVLTFLVVLRLDGVDEEQGNLEPILLPH